MQAQRAERVEQALGIDPFIKEIAFEYWGWLRPGNVWCFRHALERLPNGAPLLEIGSFCRAVHDHTLVPEKAIGHPEPDIACDPWSEPPGPADAPITNSTPITYGQPASMCTTVLSEMFRISAGMGTLAASFQLTSDEFFEAWTGGADHTDLFRQTRKLGGTFAFVYVDGNHSHSVVRRDFENIDPLLEPGGFVTLMIPKPMARAVRRSSPPKFPTWQGIELIQQAPNALFRKRDR